MKPYIRHIDNLKAELNKILPMKPEFEKRLDKKIRLEYNFNSNHIEGNTLTYGETELLLIYNQTSGDHDKRELDEMEGHDVAFNLITNWAKDKERSITETDIKAINKILLVKPFWKEAKTPDGLPTRRKILVGEYKQHPNSVELANGEIFEYASVIDTPPKMQELVQWFQEEEKKSELHPVELAAVLHHKYILIHPFDDGNGRVSRLLVNYVLLKNDLPPIIIKSNEKKKYLQALRKADVGDMDSFVEYIAGELEWSLGLSAKAAKGESLEEDNDWEKELKILSLKGESSPIKRDSKLTLVRIQDSIGPLLTEILVVSKNKIEPLFGNSIGRLLYGRTDVQFSPEGIISWDVVHILSSLWREKELVLQIRYQNFAKNGINSFSINKTITVKFLDHKYHIKFGSKVLAIEKFIDSKVTTNEIYRLKNQYGKGVLEDIKNEIKKTTTK